LTAVVAVAASVQPAAQAPRAQESSSASTYQVPRTPWGDPDIQGNWRNKEDIEFERPPGETRLFFTDEEIRAKEEDADRRNALRLTGKLENRGFRNQANYNSVVGYSPEKQTFSKQTSAIVDPPDGRVPLWTVKQVDYYEYREAMTLGRGDADWTIDRPPSERCIPIINMPTMGNWGLAMRGARPQQAEATAGRARLANAAGFTQTETTLDGGASGGGSPGSAAGAYRFVQMPGYVVILEEDWEGRIIPLDGRPALSKTFKNWKGSSRGRWEGNTLVVTTRNIQYPGPVINNYQPSYPGTGLTLTFTERYTRVGPDRMEYRYTVEDPDVYVRPYTAVHMFDLDNVWKTSYNLCHEGHDDMPAALGSGRNDEVTSVDNNSDGRLLRGPRLKEIRAEAEAYEAEMKKKQR
jgi:hypothetical protein